MQIIKNLQQLDEFQDGMLKGQENLTGLQTSL
jgi:hypothetical protein